MFESLLCQAQEVLADSPVTVAARAAQRSQVQSLGAVVGVRVLGVGREGA